MSTHTYVVLEVSSAAFNEIKARLVEAGYHAALHAEEGRVVIDLHGLALAEAPGKRDACTCYEPGRMTDPTCPVHGG